MATIPNIFGADIAGAINSALGPLVFDCTLVKTVEGVRNPADPTAGRPVTEESHAVKGFVDEYEDTNRGGTLVKRGDRIITLLGASIPGAVTPDTGDFIEIESTRWLIIPDGVTRDPAGATFTCEVEEIEAI